ncbi:MAG: NAD-dependent epimerase/dehydratase family protein [Candidatus Aminicenantes bacterium]|nr:NAD-dependent epimerase/dehydratase family protein [Candidatus Aminicenantes bacterium]
MRVLVTGSSGQLGAVISSMLSKEHSIIGVDFIPGKYTLHIGDINDHEFVLSVTKNVEIIIHTCSLHAPHLKTYSSEEFISTNINGTLNLLKSAIENKIRRFVYTSTTSLYGHAMVSTKQAVWVTEDLLPRPRDIYDVTKIAAEGLCEIYANNYDLPCISLRVSRYFPESDYLLAIYRLYRGVDVRDAATAHILAMTAERKGYEVFNISALSPFSRDETYYLFHDAPSVLLRHFPNINKLFAEKGWKLPKSIDRVYSIDKAKKILNFRPNFNFDTLLDIKKYTQ